MNEFKERKGLEFVLAVCFSEAKETFHHWKVFTHESEGVCIEFKRKELLLAFDNVANILTGSVKPILISDLEKSPPKVDNLPFIKRLPYMDEKEFRIVYLGRVAPVSGALPNLAEGAPGPALLGTGGWKTHIPLGG
jgi:hypothetical protein